MTTLIVVILAGLLTWGMRVLFITVLPADRLSERGRHLLTLTGTAVMAALAAGAVARAAVDPGASDLRGHVAAVLVAGAVARWHGNLALAVGAAITTAWGVQLLVG